MSAAVKTFHGYVETTRDSLLLFEACRQKVLPRVSRRLQEKERQLVRSGAIFCFDEDESGIKRWTDGLMWSPSRILGNFLVYRELDDKRMSENDSSVVMRSQQKNGVNPSKRQQERALFGSLKNSYRFKKDGLIKKSMSLVVNGVHQHLISYYSKDDVLANRLLTPSNSPELASLEISPDLLVRQNFRIPPFLDEDGSETAAAKKGYPRTPSLLMTANRTSDDQKIAWHDMDLPPHVEFLPARQKRRSSPYMYPPKTCITQRSSSVENNSSSSNSSPAPLSRAFHSASELRRIPQSSLSPSSPSSSSDFNSVPETAINDPLENARCMRSYSFSDDADISASNTVLKNMNQWRLPVHLNDYTSEMLDQQRQTTSQLYNQQHPINIYSQQDTLLNSMESGVPYLTQQAMNGHSTGYDIDTPYTNNQQQQQQHYAMTERFQAQSHPCRPKSNRDMEWNHQQSSDRQPYAMHKFYTMEQPSLPGRNEMFMYDSSALLSTGWNEFQSQL